MPPGYPAGKTIASPEQSVAKTGLLGLSEHSAEKSQLPRDEAVEDISRMRTPDRENALVWLVSRELVSETLRTGFYTFAPALLDWPAII